LVKLMKLLLENWRKYLAEADTNKLWVIAGPAGVGKTTRVLEPVKALGIPDLVTQDMDFIPAVEKASDKYIEDLKNLPKEEQEAGSPGVMRLSAAATPTVNVGINNFIKQNAGKDLFLVGIAWLHSPKQPFNFPPRTEKIYVYREPIEVGKSKFERDLSDEDKAKMTDEEKQSVIAGQAEITEKDYKAYDEQGWVRKTADEIVDIVRSHYMGDTNETPT